MPSNTSLELALAAVAPQREAFRSAVATAAEQIAARLQAYRAPHDQWDARAAVELGPFAAGHLDAHRFRAVFKEAEALEPSSLARLEEAHEVMSLLVAAGDEVFIGRTPPGGDLRSQVGAALANAGRAFSAGRTAEMVRLGRVDPEEPPVAVEGFPFHRWNRAERQIAPPLIMEVEGGDLQAGGLGQFLVGAQKIVLLVRGSAPVAPLVRLITPGVFVLQTSDAEELVQLLDIDGPAVGALLPEGAARFVHRPGPDELGDRLDVRYLPDRPRASLGSVSLFQQIEELAQLRVLATASAPAVSASAITAPSPSAPATEAAVQAEDPAGRLASWLLAQAGLDGPPEQASV